MGIGIQITRVKKMAITLIAALFLFANSSAIYAIELPEAPSAPSTPSAPTTPEGPSVPSIPEAPDAPEGPTAPEAPEAPSSPEAPDAPDASTAPGVEEDKNNQTEENTSVSRDSGVSTSGSTGESSDSGMGDAEISTGDATTTASVTTNANSSLSVGESDGGSIEIINAENGPGSQNSASVAVTGDSSTKQTNSALVSNDVNQSVTTGDNSASGNMGSATIETGDANTTATVITAVNTNVDGVMVSEFNVIDDHVGDIILDFGSSCISGCGTDVALENSGNGTDSQNDTDVLSSDTDATFQSNDATVENNLVLDSDSGDNETNKNMAGAQIDTGDANVSANVLTFANNNIAGDVIYAVVNVFGDLIGDIIFPESTLLAGGSNDTSVVNSDNAVDSKNTIVLAEIDASAVSQFNTADIQNNVAASATTGDNTADKNMGGDTSISTGDASATAQVINIANLNLATGDYWLVIVNEAGRWVGKILGAPEGSNVASSSLLEFEIEDNGDISLANKDNGSDSNNSITLNSDSSSEIVQENTAIIVNNLDLSANTGGNTADKNMNGDTSIETGDADIVANIVNFVNNNITGGGRLFVNVVNVFGSWVGDFVSPGESKSESVASADDSPAVGGAQNSPNESSQNGGSNTTQKGSSVVFAASDTIVAAVASAVRTSGNRVNTKAISTTDSNNDGEVITMVASESIISDADPTKTLNVNLAWITMLIPVYLLVAIAKKKQLIIIKTK